MKIINKKTPYNERREIIIVDLNDLPKGKIDTELVKNTVGYAVLPLLSMGIGIFKIGYDLYNGKLKEEK